MTQLTKRERLDKLEEEIRDLLAEDAVLEWSGAGLPPVGTGCEAVWLELPDGGDSNFERVIIKGYWENQVWFCTADGEDFTHLLANVDFRPIPTQAQLEREELTVDLLGILPFCEYDESQIKELAKILYTQGYRKPDAGMLRRVGE